MDRPSPARVLPRISTIQDANRRWGEVASDMQSGLAMEPSLNAAATDPILSALADDLCVLAYDIENSLDDVDVTLARRARALCNELRTLAKAHGNGRDSASVSIYVEDVVRRGRALLASSDSQPPSEPASRRNGRTSSGTHQRVLADLVFDDDPPTSPGAPHAIHAMAARLLLSI